MTLDKRTGNLIAVGAAITANCQGCLSTTVARAIDAGAEPQDVADAIAIGRRVRSGAAAKLDDFAATLDVPASTTPVVQEATCRCES